MTTKRKKLTPEEQQALLDTPNINEEFTKATGLTLPLQLEVKDNCLQVPEVITKLAEKYAYLPLAERPTFGYKFIDWEDIDARYNGITWNPDQRFPSYKTSDTKMGRFIQQHSWKRVLAILNAYEPNRSVALAKENRDIHAEECLTKGFNEIDGTGNGSAENTRRRTEAQRHGRNILYNDENIDEALGGRDYNTGAFIAKVGPFACPINETADTGSGLGFNKLYNRILTAGPFQQHKGEHGRKIRGKVYELMSSKQWDKVIELAEEVANGVTTKGVRKNITELRRIDFGSIEKLYLHLTELGYKVFGGKENAVTSFSRLSENEIEMVKKVNADLPDSASRDEQPTSETGRDEQSKPSIWDNLLKYFIRSEATI